MIGAEMNIDRMLRVRDVVLAEPDRLELLDDFVAPRFDADRFVGVGLCIAARAALDAGFIELRDTPRPGAPRTYYDVTPAGLERAQFMRELGAAALDLSDAQARRLFYVDEWPSRMASAFLQSKQAPARASVTARRIDHFMRTEGAE